MTAHSRYRSIVDVHLLLLRDGDVLLTRRANTGYADGLLHLVSGHLEDGEDVVDAAIREAGEEVGIGLSRSDLTCVHVMHHRNPEEQGRVGFFFQATSWRGEPTNREPDKCSEVGWWPLAALPDDIVPYPAEALRQILAGAAFSVHGWPRAGADAPAIEPAQSAQSARSAQSAQSAQSARLAGSADIRTAGSPAP